MAMLLRSLKARVIARGARNYRAYADLAVAYEERVWSSNGTENRVIRMPSGPAVVITPWNAPFMLSTWKTAPALAAGCTVVLKPAEWSPLSCSLLADLADEAGFPPGVFNVVQGIGEEMGAALVAHPGVRRISFTGSPETARAIGVGRGAQHRAVHGELGGKGPLLVFADCDIEAAARKAAGQYDDAGQVCLAGTRLLVEEHGRRDASWSSSTALPTSTCSATHATTRPRLAAHPSRASRAGRGFRGARARRTVTRSSAAGGGRSIGGLFYEPTLVVPRSNDSEIVQREVFGPVLTFQTFADEDEAVALANSTPYGLSGIVYTGSRDTRRACRAGSARRDGLGEHLPRPRPDRAVRRHRHLGHRPGGRRLRARLLLRPEDAADRRGDDVVSVAAFADAITVEDLDRDPYPIYARHAPRGARLLRARGRAVVRDALGRRRVRGDASRADRLDA